jgi:methionyl-tRNA formyltransferase
VTYAAKITKAEARIDWRLSASDIERRVRAFNPQPIAETVLAESRLRIFAGRVYEGSDNPAAAPGSVIAVHAAGPVVQCGEGALILSQVQRPGRKVVRGSEFAAGADLLGRLLG